MPKGPAGTAFYTPSGAVPKKHGSPIWQRKLTGPAVLKSAKSNTLLLYSSTSIAGKPVPVSGTVSVPKGKAPKGGWPVVSWAHGTTGIADACAPSITGMPATYDQPLMNKWLKAGFAVVRTDYEGLGTPGEHPFLIGESEGRSVLDMVVAARSLDKTIGKNMVVAGHSQGGHAALWAASLAKKWTPALKLKRHAGLRARLEHRRAGRRCCNTLTHAERAQRARVDDRPRRRHRQAVAGHPGPAL